MNEITNKFLLTGHKYMSEIHLRQPVLPIVIAEHLLKK